jgi:BlaI family transcriptional regulator, penicillinase repressor
MSRKPSKTLTDRELEIMQVLWSLGRARLGEVQDALNEQAEEPVAPSTVATQLNLLIHKGYVTQTGRPGRSRYVPTCSREETTRDLLGAFLARIGLGRAPAFLIQLLKDEKLTPEDRAALEAILRESEPGTPRRPRRRPAAPPSSEETTP